MRTKIRIVIFTLVSLYYMGQVGLAANKLRVDKLVVGYDVIRIGQKQLIQVTLKNEKSRSIPIVVHAMATLPSRNIVLAASKRAIAEDRSYTRVLLDYPLKRAKQGRYLITVRVFDNRGKIITRSLQKQFAQFYVYKRKPPANWKNSGGTKKQTKLTKQETKDMLVNMEGEKSKGNLLAASDMLILDANINKSKAKNNPKLSGTNTGAQGGKSLLSKSNTKALSNDVVNPVIVDNNKAIQHKKIDEDFTKPDMIWYRLLSKDASVLRGETGHVSVWLKNQGGDNAEKIKYALYWFLEKNPSRKVKFFNDTIPVLAPGEVSRVLIPLVLPSTESLGEYKIYGVIDPDSKINETNKKNNRQTSTNSFIFDDIAIVSPLADKSGKINLSKSGRTKFAWRSHKFSQFKVQISPNVTFSDTSLILEIPKGDRWTSLKEIDPMQGELFKLATTLMKTQKVDSLFWRIAGRDLSGVIFYSQTYTLYFTDDDQLQESNMPKTQEDSAVPQ